MANWHFQRFASCKVNTVGRLKRNEPVRDTPTQSGLKVDSVSEREHHMIYGLELSAAAAAAIHGTRFSGTVSTDLALITYVIISTAEQNMWRAEVLFGLFLSFS